MLLSLEPLPWLLDFLIASVMLNVTCGLQSSIVSIGSTLSPFKDAGSSTWCSFLWLSILKKKRKKRNFQWIYFIDFSFVIVIIICPLSQNLFPVDLSPTRIFIDWNFFILFIAIFLSFFYSFLRLLFTYSQLMGGKMKRSQSTQLKDLQDP